jgi:hypothetical protein
VTLKKWLIAAGLFGVLMSVAHAQDSGAGWQDRLSDRQDRLAERAERRAERLAERAERLAERAERRAERWERRWDRHGSNGVHLRLLSDYTLADGDVSNEPVVVIGGTATIEGRVADDVVVIGGSARLGPKAVVLGDVVAVGGEAILAPGAQVSGEVSRTTVAWSHLGPGWSDPARGWWAAIGVTWTIVRLTALVIAALLLTLVAPGLVRRISLRAGATPWSSVATGLAAEVLFVPTVAVVAVVLLISIVGIPLLGAMPLVFAAAAAVCVAGFTGVAARLGARVRGRNADASSTPVADVAFGALLLVFVALAARLVGLGPDWLQPVRPFVGAVALVVEFAVWTLGIGAVLQTIADRWRPAVSGGAPPVPSIPTTAIVS